MVLAVFQSRFVNHVFLYLYILLFMRNQILQVLINRQPVQFLLNICQRELLPRAVPQPIQNAGSS